VRIARPLATAEAPAAPLLERAWRAALLVSVALLPFPGVLADPLPGTAMRWSDPPLALALLLFAVARGPRLRLAGWAWAVLAYAAWAGVSWLHHRGGADALKAAAVVALAGSALLAAELERRDLLARVVALGVIGSAAFALLGLGLHLAGLRTELVGWSGDLVAGAWARPRAGSTHPNLAASFALFAFGVAAAERSPKLRALAQAAAVLVVVVTFSRALLALLALPWLVAGGRRARLTVLGVAAILFALTAVRVDVDPSRPWTAELSDWPSPRLVTFVTACDSLAAAPLFGVGPGVQPATLAGSPFHAHCTPLSVAASYGLPALLAFAVAVLGALRPGGDPFARATLAALLLDGLAIDVEDFRHFWLALGLAAARPPEVTSGSAGG
jgi:hypothetical protein